MKAYLDGEDSYYGYNEESVKEELINVKVNRDYAGIGAIIFTFTVISIVIGLSIYTAWQIAYGYEGYESQESKLDTYQECMHYLTKWDKMIITMGLMIGLVGALIAGLIMWVRK